MSYKKIISKFWNSQEQVLSFAETGPSRYLRGFFLKIKNPKGKKVLDLGCGGGRNTEMLLRFGFDVFACDLHEEMVKFTKKRIKEIDKEASKKIEIASMSSLPYPECYFDFVVSNGVFHNAENLKELNLSMSETARVLKEGGFFIMNMFVKDNSLNKEFNKKRGEKYLYFTKKGLPIILLPVYGLIDIFLKNNLKILSYSEDWITIKAGKRKIFRAICQKNNKIKNLPLLNLRTLIDECDKKILSVFFDRINLVKKIKKYKKRTGLPLIDDRREYEIYKKLLKFSRKHKLNFSNKKIKKMTSFILKISR